MAENRDIEQNIFLNYKTNADSQAKQIDKLNTAVEGLDNAQDKATKSTKDLNATFEDVYGDLKPLTARMGEAEDRLYELALAGQQASKEYQELLGVVANYRKTQMETDRVVDASATTLGQKLAGASQIAAVAIQGTTAGMALFGDVNEDIEKTLLKVQAAMAFSDSVSQISMMGGQINALKTTVVEAWVAMTTAKTAETASTETNNSAKAKGVVLTGGLTGATTIQTVATTAATVATNLFNAALAIATAPITLLIVGIAGLVAGIGYLSGAFGDFSGEAARAEKANASLNKEIDKQTKATESANEKTELYNNQVLAMAKAQGKSAAEVRALAVELINSEAAEKRLNAVKAYSIYLEAQRVAGLENATEAQKETAKKATESYKEQLNVYKEVLKEKNKLTLDNQVAEVQEATDRAKLLLDKQKEAAAKALEEKKRAEEEERKRQEQLIKDRITAEENALKQLQDLNDKTEEEKLARQKERDLEAIEALRQRGVDVENLLIYNTEKYNMLEDELRIKREEEEKERELEYWAKESDDAIARDEEAKAREEAVFAHKQEINDKLNDLQQQGFATAKMLFAKNKGIQKGILIAENAVGLASVAINTAKGISTAMAKGAAGIPEAVIVGASGALSAVNIIAATAKGLKALGGGSAGGGGGSSQAVPSGGAVPQVDFQTSSENQIGNTLATNVNEAAPVQAFVVSSEVTTAQALDRNRIESNSF